MDIPEKIRKLIRKIAGQSGKSYPIVIISGRSKPKLTGKSYYWTTPSGKLIHYPNAYRWTKVYHSSSLSIEVGDEWLYRRGFTIPFLSRAKISLDLVPETPDHVVIDRLQEDYLPKGLSAKVVIDRLQKDYLTKGLSAK